MRGEQVGRPEWGEGSDLPGRCVLRLQGKVRRWSGRGNHNLGPFYAGTMGLTQSLRSSLGPGSLWERVKGKMEEGAR